MLIGVEDEQYLIKFRLWVKAKNPMILQGLPGRDCLPKEAMLRSRIMNPKKLKSYFRITYRDPIEGKVVDLKATKVEDSNLGLGFIAVSDFVFDLNPVLADLAQENLRKRLEDVKSVHLSVYTIISIEEVGVRNRGLTFKNDKSNLVLLPSAAQLTKN